LIEKNYGDTSFVTGMRAFAALAVVLIHTGGGGLRSLGVIGNNIADFGRSGVYVFFVISGFSVSASYVLSSGYFDYINKRLWRIAPIYYFWIGVTIFLGLDAVYWQERFAVGLDSYNLLMHVFFLGFLDYRITNSIIGVEWSISIEVFWYFVLPFILFSGKNNYKNLICVLCSLFLYVASGKYWGVLPLNERDAALALSWSPIPYMFSYALGIAAYSFRGYFSRSNLLGNIIFVTVVILMSVYVVSPQFILRIFHDEVIFVSLLTFVIILFGTGESVLFKIVLNNRFVQLIGVVSYGIYLCHIPLTGLLVSWGLVSQGGTLFKFVFVSACAFGVSFVTYYSLERWFVSLGRRFGGYILSRVG